MELSKRELTLLRSALNHVIAKHVVAHKEEHHPDMKVIRHDIIEECKALKKRVIQEYLDKDKSERL